MGFTDYQELYTFYVLKRLSLTYLFTSLAFLPVLLRYAPHTTAVSKINKTVVSEISRASGWSGSQFWRSSRSDGSRVRHPSCQLDLKALPAWRTAHAAIWAPAAYSGTQATRIAPEERTGRSLSTSSARITWTTCPTLHSFTRLRCRLIL